MIRKWCRALSSIAFVFGIQGAFAAEAWLLVTSDLPGAAVSVDNIYRGVTPQRSSDALRIRVSEGVRVIEVRKQVNGREYAKKQTVNVTKENENLVRFNLRKKTASISVIPTGSSVQNSESRFGRVIPLGKLEVPGRNF